MKKQILPILLLAALPLMAHAVWVDSKGKPLPDKPSRQTLGTFGAQTVLFADEKQLEQEWKARPLPTKLTKIDTAKRNSTVITGVFFFGCEPNKEGRCDVVAQFTLELPDGSTLPAADGAVWSAPPPPRDVAQLSPLRMKVTLDDKDPYGEYTIHTKVKDRVSGKLATLKSTFKLKRSR